MLETFFVVVTVFLIAICGLLYKEHVTGIRHAPSLRAILDRETRNTAAKARHVWSISLHFIKHAVLLKGLHMVTYLALVNVRFMERKLMLLSQKLRSFRKDHNVLRRSTHKLTQWQAHSENEETRGE